MAPELVRIEGISIVVYGRDHLPPHIHVFHGDDEALVEIRTGDTLKGFLSHKKLLIVQRWLAENRNLAETNFYELNPALSILNYGRKRKSPTNKKRKNK